MDTFEISIQNKSADCWPILARCTQDNVSSHKEGSLKLTEEDFTNLYSLLGNDKEYGIRLGQALFQGDINLFFEKARTVNTSKNGKLHISLFVQATDSDLRILRWERLCVPYPGKRWDFLVLDTRLPFSVAISSEITRQFQANEDLRALVLVASPEPGRYSGLAPFDVEQTVSDVQKALGENVQCDILANMIGASGPPTLTALCHQMNQKQYTLLHIVCHGRMTNEETFLYWADKKNKVSVIKGQKLIDRLDKLEVLPHLVFLSTCESASSEAEGQEAEQVLETLDGGLAQQFIRKLGIPAVVAMADKVTIKTAQSLAVRFYEQLMTSEQPCVALSQAALELADRDDATVPVLFSKFGNQFLMNNPFQKLKRLPPEPPVSLATAKHNSFNPDYLWYLPGRTEQKKKLRNAIYEYEKTATHRPLLCMIHGDEREALYEFKEYVVEAMLPEVAKFYRNSTSDSDGIRQIAFSLNFENIDELHDDILTKLEDRLLVRNFDEDFADPKTNIANHIVAEKRPVILCVTVHTKYYQHQHDQQDIIKQGFIDFWADWPKPAKNKRYYRLLVFLLFQYPKPDKTGWSLKGLIRLFKNKPSSIEQFSQKLFQLEKIDFSSCLQEFSVGTIILPQLSSIKEKEAILWLENECQKYNAFITRKHIKTAKTEIETFYKNHPNGVAMETLAKKLEDILKQVTGIS